MVYRITLPSQFYNIKLLHFLKMVLESLRTYPNEVCWTVSPSSPTLKMSNPWQERVSWRIYINPVQTRDKLG